MPNWKETNIDAGTLVAFVIGILSLVATVVGVQSWVDNRISQRVAPIELEMRELKQEIRDSLASSNASRNRQYGELLSKFDELLEAQR